MCGIAGAVYAKTVSAAQAEALIFDMNMALGHRGPDASGDYFDHNNSVVLGHTRLSIIDLSSSRSSTNAFFLRPLLDYI